MSESLVETAEVAAPAELVPAPVPAPKPPPQVMGVVGIDPIKVTMGAPQMDWHKLCSLPPFQMFAAEKMPMGNATDSYAHAASFVQTRASSPEIVNDYIAWHTAKNLWPAETPFGALKEASHG